MKWYTITAKGEVAEIWLYDEIGKDFFGDGVTAKEFLAELNAIKSPRIDMHINSPGGGNVTVPVNLYLDGKVVAKTVAYYVPRDGDLNSAIVSARRTN